MARSTKMNRLKMKGKNFMPALPAERRTVEATNSYVISVIDCHRLGTSAFLLVPTSMKMAAMATMSTMNSAALVKLAFTPKGCKETIGSITN